MSLGFVDVSGVGNSGKSALVDLLREFDGLWVPEYWFEFDFLRVPGGLLSLRAALCDDWSPIRSHMALREFHDLVEKMGIDPAWWNVAGLLRSTSQRYDSRFGGRFRELSHAFADSLVIGRYVAEWPFDSLRESDWTRFRRKILRRLGMRRHLQREVLLVDGNDFGARSTRYLSELYGTFVPPGTHTVVANNAFEPFNPLGGLDLIAQSRQIVVTRDPRDIFVSGLSGHAVAAADRALLAGDNDGLSKSFLGTDDLPMFVERYRLYRRKLYRGNDPRVLHLRFEDLIGRYEESLEKVVSFLGLSRASHRRPLQSFSPERSGKNVGLWRKYSDSAAVAYIARELADSLVS